MPSKSRVKRTITKGRNGRGNNGGGNRDRFTQTQMIAVLEKHHGILKFAAMELGCNRETVAAYRDKYPNVRKACEEGPEIVTDVAEHYKIRAVMNGQMTHVDWWLRTKGRARGYGDMVKAEVTGDGGGPVKILVQFEEPRK